MSYPADTRQRQALQLAEQIATVRAQLTELEAQFFALVGDGSDVGSSTAQRSTPKATETSSTSQAAQVLAVFERQAGKRVPIQTVVGELPHIDAGLIRSTAARFYRDGKLKRAGRGIYKYVPTQPNEDPEG